jgi:ATP-dependent helicase/nuclease subunit A
MQCLERVVEHKALLGVADLLTPALSVGRRFALAWDAAKLREGLVDFDDLIRRAAALLGRRYRPWIAYKLDRRFDHILVDEAQDTNAAQWSIVRALTGDFFTGLGQRDGKLRTIFVVGDYKQAIFRFQGTSPENFRVAKEQFAAEMAEAARNAARCRVRLDARELSDLGLGRSYRTSMPVLEFVERAIAAIGPENFGLDRRARSARRRRAPGAGHAVESGLRSARRRRRTAKARRPGCPSPSGAWPTRSPSRSSAGRHFPLAKRARPRLAGPGDIMVLVRQAAASSPG